MSRLPLVFVPGLGCDGAVWRGQIAAFGGIADCIQIDHGNLDSISGMAASLLRSAPPRFILAGHSMGGRVAQEIMRIAPERVERLALVDTGHTSVHPDRPETAERMALVDLAYAQGMRVMARQWVQDMVHPDRLGDTVLIDDILDMLDRKTADIFHAQTRALLNRPGFADVLPTIRVPTVVIAGNEDSKSPPEMQRTIARAIPGSHLVLVEGCGHMAPMERPDAVTRAMRAWLDA